MSNNDRRKFLKWAALGAAGSMFRTESAYANTPILTGKLELTEGGKDFSLVTKQERKAIPSACWQCVNCDAIVGYVENDRLVKIEGNPDFLTSGGKVCARGQAGVNQVYHPDRLLHPLKRVGKRGEGKWEQISWDEAMELLLNGGEIAGRQVKGLQTLRDEGTPEKFVFHYGRMTGSDYLLNRYVFLPAYGTGSVGNHNSICVAPAGTGYGYIGGTTSSVELKDTKLYLNFGSSFFDAGFSMVSGARAKADALANGMKMYTFDVRLSNTAAKSTEWIPVKPGTDLAVALALCNVLIENDLADKEYIANFTNVEFGELQEHLAQYTPEWAEQISGVPADKIRSIGIEVGTIKPGRVDYMRGLFMHYNGVQAVRALTLLEALAGYGEAKGSQGGRPRWSWGFPFPQPEEPPKSLNLFSGEPGVCLDQNPDLSHQIAHMLDKGEDRPEIYLVYCHNPVYSNGGCEENARVYKDEEKVPFLVASDVVLSETSELADLVLPDATYLERYTLEGKSSPDNVLEFYLRQPMHPPLGEARNWINVALELANRMELGLGFSTVEEYVRATCDNTPGIKEAGGFEYMKEHGIWHDDTATTSEYDQEPLTVKHDDLESAGYGGMPTWMPIPGHDQMADNELVLTTYKLPTQTHSRTQGCKWLTELHHDNRAWINSRTAAHLGIADGDKIRVTSEIGSIETTAFVTEGVQLKAIAISHHCGHWAWGQYASGKKSVNHVPDADTENKWWKNNGTHVNLIIPPKGEPIGGGMCWMDTVVKVEKA